MSAPVKPVSRVRLSSMPSDPCPIEPGTTGTVLAVTTGLLAQIQIKWDDHRSLSLIPGVDEYEIIGHSDLVADCMACPRCRNRAMDLLEWDEPCEQVTCALCGTVYEP